MKKSIELKLQQLLERFQEVNVLLADPDTISDSTKFKNLSKEFAQLEPLAHIYENYLTTTAHLTQLDELLNDNDPDLVALAKEERLETLDNIAKLEENLQLYLIPIDPEDERSVYLEIRAGTGGDEAAIFAGDLFRMYSRYAEIHKWSVEIISTHHGEHGGFKEIIALISGANVYAQLKFESGTHRVQRVPTTEAQGRIHTSACTVAVLPEIEEINEISITADELRIDTYRSSGAGGQHVNKTDSAIRITHLPTGLVVECQDERSQHKNRARAMALLKSRLLNAEQTKQRQAQAETRKSLVGSGDRSERIRTYNFPQSRLTDHRINLTLYQLDNIMNGELDIIIDALKREHHATLLAEIGQE